MYLRLILVSLVTLAPLVAHAQPPAAPKASTPSTPPAVKLPSDPQSSILALLPTDPVELTAEVIRLRYQKMQLERDLGAARARLAVFDLKAFEIDAVGIDPRVAKILGLDAGTSSPTTPPPPPAATTTPDKK